MWWNSRGRTAAGALMSIPGMAGRFAFLLLALAVPSAAAAQAPSSPRDRIYIGGSILSVTRPAAVDYHGYEDFRTPLLSGTTAGVSGTFGIRLSPAVSGAVEVAWLGTLSHPPVLDSQGHVFGEATLHETTIGFVIHLHPMNRRISVEPVYGWVIAFEDVLKPGLQAARTDAGIVWGADAVFVLSPRFSFDASFRWEHFLHRYRPPSEDQTSVGLGNALYQVGAGLRWTIR